ncbi:hypothetical protein L1987_85462 [Smallanthus sonchifolius]|uniref:Uncharacterized protein n=1 Tax=Smallanthus sonchifolius TaxID=185202 RepID=A0ACB8XX77_9ASTR|nr:hypothetical protein L1987_85462 [Smallanthus sonchifolius]
MISMAVHRNLLRLKGFCMTPTERLLVYPFMANGSVASWLREKTDVFGYGVMLLELITGQRAFDLARLANDDDVMLLDWVKGLLREKKLETLVDADLKGDGLAERWEEWQKEEMFRQEFNTAHNPNTDWIIADSTYNLRPDELSGPR